MKVVWTASALRDRDEIGAYIAQENPTAAIRLDQSFEAAGKRLERFPLAGRPGVTHETRELIPHPSYRIVYGISNQELLILRVVHTSRLWPPVKDDGSA